MVLFDYLRSQPPLLKSQNPEDQRLADFCFEDGDGIDDRFSNIHIITQIDEYFRSFMPFSGLFVNFYYKYFFT